MNASDRDLSKLPENTPTIHHAYGGHAPHTTSPDLLKRVQAADTRLGQRFCLHLAESREETGFLQTGKGAWADFMTLMGIDFSLWNCFRKRPVEMAHAAGLLDQNTLAVHLLEITSREAHHYPVFHLTAVTHRENPIYPATIVGYPPMEDQWLGKVTERLFLPLIQQQLPEIVDMNLPVEGCFHNLCFVSIRKRYPGHAQKVMQAIWGLGQMMFTKMIFVFDREVDVQDLSQVLFHLGGNVDPIRDATMVKGPVDALDHASTLPHLGTKMGMDCTAKWATEGYDRQQKGLTYKDESLVTSSFPSMAHSFKVSISARTGSKAGEVSSP